MIMSLKGWFNLLIYDKNGVFLNITNNNNYLHGI